jgi:hypothetical protein
LVVVAFQLELGPDPWRLVVLLVEYCSDTNALKRFVDGAGVFRWPGLLGGVLFNEEVVVHRSRYASPQVLRPAFRQLSVQSNPQLHVTLDA